MVEAAAALPTERLLAVIDIFAETEGRMRWATNKRLHLEIGLIKAVQSLGEVRINDVIKVLAAGAGHVTEAPAPVTAPTSPAPAPAPQPAPAPKPEPKPASNGGSTLDSIDQMIADAPDEAVEAIGKPKPKPQAAPKAEPEAEKPKPQPKAVDEDFYEDPLIQKALDMFEAKIRK